MNASRHEGLVLGAPARKPDWRVVHRAGADRAAQLTHAGASPDTPQRGRALDEQLLGSWESVGGQRRELQRVRASLAHGELSQELEAQFAALRDSVSAGLGEQRQRCLLLATPPAPLAPGQERLGVPVARRALRAP